MQTHRIYVAKGRDWVDEIRTELFVFPEVLDVFVTGRPDALVVVCQGRPRPAEWLRALRAVGYELPHRGRVGTHAENVARTAVLEPLRCEPPSPQTGPALRVRTYYAA
jgi:hypothetical protein